MRNKTNILLGISTVILIVLCVASISVPMNFEAERQQREKLVKERLITIRQAEESYRNTHGTYCGNIEKLVKTMKLPLSTALIPGTGNKKWLIKTAEAPGSNGKTVPLMECGATYSEYLNGLNPQEIEKLTLKAEDAGRYPGLKIGNIITPDNNAGNWE